MLAKPPNGPSELVSNIKGSNTQPKMKEHLLHVLAKRVKHSRGNISYLKSQNWPYYLLLIFSNILQITLDVFSSVLSIKIRAYPAALAVLNFYSIDQAYKHSLREQIIYPASFGALSTEKANKNLQLMGSNTYFMTLAVLNIVLAFNRQSYPPHCSAFYSS
jgi:hypothetical protein